MPDPQEDQNEVVAQQQAAVAAPDGPKDIKMKAFVSDSDPDETGRLWEKWREELLTRFRYFQNS